MVPRLCQQLSAISQATTLKKNLHFFKHLNSLCSPVCALQIYKLYGVFLEAAQKHGKSLQSEEKFTILLPNLHQEIVEAVANQTSMKITNSWSISLSTLPIFSISNHLRSATSVMPYRSTVVSMRFPLQIPLGRKPLCFRLKLHQHLEV